MGQVDHGTRKHALLSASGASRWINCTPSPRLEEQFTNVETSYAEEGTLAHEFAELGIRKAMKQLTAKQYKAQTDPLYKSPLYSDEMDEEVQKHIDYVLAQYTEAKRKTKDALLLIEEKVDLTYFIEDGFGTCDDVIIADGTMEVIDLKYGKGVKVSAEDNSQLKLYGLGALRAHELMYDIHTVRLTIVQPRLDNISSWEISAEDLNKWGEEIVKPKAELAYAGEGEQAPGEWCRFCKAKGRCKALAEQNLEIAKHEFADPQLLSDKELIEAYKLMPQLQDWINGVAEYLLHEAVHNNKKWPEYKLVEGRSNRMWANAEKVEAVLKENNFNEDEILVSKLAGITAIEKVVGKANFNTLLGELVVKPQGKPTLVPETDKRPAYGLAQAQSDFSE